MRAACICVSTLVSAVVLVPASAHAQTPPRVEVGVAMAARDFENDIVVVRSAVGVGGQVDVHLNSLLALEARGAWFPRQESSRFRSQGGRTGQLSAGARATFVRRPRWAFYAITLGGMTRASNAYSDLFSHTELLPDGLHDVVESTLGSVTRFTLTMGAGLELRPWSQWTVRMDLTTNLTPFSGSIVYSPPLPNGAQLGVGEGGAMADHDQFSLSVARRIGALRATSDTVLGGRMTVVATATSLTTSRTPLIDLDRRAGAGAAVSYRLLRHLDADGGFASYHAPPVTTSDAGGSLFQVLAGVRAGARAGRVGCFAKIRFGAARHSRVLQIVDMTRPRRASDYGPFFEPLMDVGAVVEVSLWRNLIGRIDAGSLNSLPHDVTFLYNREPISSRTEFNTSLSFAFGAGIRF